MSLLGYLFLAQKKRISFNDSFGRRVKEREQIRSFISFDLGGRPIHRNRIKVAAVTV